MEVKKRLTVAMAGMSTVMQEIIAAGGTADITVMGNSMFPMLKHGVSRVKLTAPRALKSGDLPLYRRKNGAFVLHRVIKVHGDTYSMCGDNQYILEPGIKQDQILAVVTEFSRDGKKWVKSTNLIYRIYVRFWMLVRILKRLVDGVFNITKRFYLVGQIVPYVVVPGLIIKKYYL